MAAIKRGRGSERVEGPKDIESLSWVQHLKSLQKSLGITITPQHELTAAESDSEEEEEEEDRKQKWLHQKVERRSYRRSNPRRNVEFHQKIWGLRPCMPLNKFNDLPLFTADGVRNKILAASIGQSVVGLASYIAGTTAIPSSGLIYKWDGTTASIVCPSTLLGRTGVVHKDRLQILVHLWGDHVEGEIVAYDLFFDVAIVRAKFDKAPQVSRLDYNTRCSEGDNVISIARYYEDSTLMVAHGKVLPLRTEPYARGHFCSDCKITAAGLGGPVVNVTTGRIIGINSCRGKVAEDSVTKKYNLQKGDVISYVDGTPITSHVEYVAKLLDVGHKLSLSKEGPWKLEYEEQIVHWICKTHVVYN